MPSPRHLYHRLSARSVFIDDSGKSVGTRNELLERGVLELFGTKNILRFDDARPVKRFEERKKRERVMVLKLVNRGCGKMRMIR